VITEYDMKFIVSLKVYVQKNPHMVAALIQVIQDGINDALEETMHRAADMESVAAMALNARVFKGNQSIIADKLEKWKGRSALRWDDMIKKLRKATP
jgi:ABC-type nitrate/sulfonate/bicarbonate transport system substrate-binding protein